MEEAYATVTNIADSYAGHVPLRDLLSKLYASGSTERVEAQLRRKDGSPWTANLYLRAVTDSQGNIAYIEGFVEDITERKRAAEERLTLERQVQHAQKLESLGVLASGIAHDFNNILMAVLGYADLAKSELPAQHPACQSLSEIEKGAIRAAELTRQMLAYSGKGHFVIEVMDVSHLINEMVDLLRTSISRSISLNVQLARDLPPIKADAGQIQQIVLNLITNASEAIGDQPGVITVSTGQALCSQEHLAHSLTNITSEDAPPPGRYVYFQVTDTGCGMDDDTKLRVFDPFFTTKFTGRGLGMAAVLGIVRGHNGAIMLETKPGIGTTFKVFFPAAPEKQVDCRQRPTKRPEMPQSKQGTILVIDDEIAVRNLTEKVLTRQGYSVLLAEDGIQGTALFEEHADNIVCVLLDLTMPRMGGEACFDQLQSIRANIPVLLSSGYSEQTAIKQFSGKHIAGFIQKPYQPMKLVAKIRECIES